VLTVHRAKGLEFKSVYVSGLVEGRFPVKARPATLSLPDELIGDADADEDRALAEERRLFFVAVTRARDELVLTSHENGRGGRGRRRPSILIAQALDAPPRPLCLPPGASPPRRIWPTSCCPRRTLSQRNRCATDR